MLKMSSCDCHGEVYISTDAVYRVVNRNYKDSVLSVMNAIHLLNIDGIVQTKICSENEGCCGIDNPLDALILKHRKITFISYPHEWCASMLKDAALFHLELSEQLLGQALFLKDAHPWNILFEKGRPVFVDFTSIVSSDSLFSEEYIESNKLYEAECFETRLALVFKEIFERMYLPYFINPLCSYAFGQRKLVRKKIEITTLNSSTSLMGIRDYLPEPIPLLSNLTKILTLLRSRFEINNALLRLMKKNDIKLFFREVGQCVRGLKVEIGTSAYCNYYKLKGEDDDWNFSEKWNAKQKTVFKALNTPEVNTVLDVACNTGWFAVLAEKLGKRVVAFDIDEACIEILYNQVKKDQLDILPLVLNFTELTQDRYSIYDGRKILINAIQRLRSDSVMVLGILHHLTLGLGLAFEEILDRLIPLCEKQLIIEFVDASDSMIQNEPSFFPAYFNNIELLSKYELSKLIGLCEERGFEVHCESSYPSTRTILVCKKCQ
jgi:SAM-dependent methyltransferase